MLKLGAGTYTKFKGEGKEVVRAKHVHQFLMASLGDSRIGRGGDTGARYAPGCYNRAPTKEKGGTVQAVASQQSANGKG